MFQFIYRNGITCSNGISDMIHGGSLDGDGIFDDDSINGDDNISGNVTRAGLHGSGGADSRPLDVPSPTD